MATEIYKINSVTTIDGKEIEIIPLRIKYMRQFMDVFNFIKNAKDDDESIVILCECVRIAMKQYCPELSTSIDIVEDSFDLKTIYEILDYSVGIKINSDSESEVNKQAIESKEDSNWDNLDLAKLETEAFLLGIWKNYEELESSISIAELISIISTRRELDYDEKKFAASLQGVNLEGSTDSNKGQKEWEDMKARVFSGGATSDSNDILALQGQNAKKAGFGIGMGLDYEVINN